ncbi:MAG: autotransporter domain-containing protein [Prosthecobacter sp.]
MMTTLPPPRKPANPFIVSALLALIGLFFAAPASALTTITSTFSYTGPAVAIPDAITSHTGPGALASASILVSGFDSTATITNVVFKFDGTVNATQDATNVGLTHSFVGDLKISLTSPGSTSVMMIDRIGSSTPTGFGQGGNNFSQLVLDDTATPLIESATGATFNGTFRPNNALSAFIGGLANGTWTLSAQDFGQADTGSIRAFSIIITATATPPATHWLGRTDGLWSGANWASDAAGTATTASPGSNSDITFSGAGAAHKDTTLDQDFTIKSLTINDTVSISGDKTLTVTNNTLVDNGTLTINSGITLSSVSGEIGRTAGTSGTVNVTGSGAQWIMSGDLDVDTGGTGTLNILDGGTVQNETGVLASYTATAATVTVDGSFSSWRNNNNLVVGGSGPGTLNIQNGAEVIVWDGAVSPSLGMVELAETSGSSGTLNFGSATTPGSSGTLSAAEIHGGGGTAVVNFNQVDEVVLDASITGSTSVNQTNADGLTVLTGENTYTGTTNVSAGALAITNALHDVGSVTIAEGAMLTGNGMVQTATNNSIYLNGILNVQAAGPIKKEAMDNAAKAKPRTFATSFSLGTSGTGSIVMGHSSFIVIDLFDGAGMGDNTRLKDANDMLFVNGTLDATAGGTLVVNNATGMTGFAKDDQWQIMMLKGGTVVGDLAVDISGLGLDSSTSGEFDKTTGIFRLVSNGAEISAETTGLATANAQDQTVMAGMQSILGDINGRLFNLRAGGGEEGSSGGIASSIDEGVVVGQGDGPEDPVAKKVLRSRQWEVYTTVNYANISLSSIGQQAGVDSQTWSPGVGIERHLSRHWAVGFAASLLETHQTYNNNLGTLDVQGVAFSAYASYVRGGFWGDVLYNFGRFDLESDRNPGFAFPVAHGETTAWTNAVQLNTGWNFRFQENSLVTGPFVGVDYLHVTVDSYSEMGGGAAALAFAKRDTDSLITRVGWSVSKRFETDFASITPQFRVGYERQNISNNNGTSVNLVNQPFSASTTSQAPGQDYVIAGVGVNFQFSPAFSLLVTYQGQFFRENMQAHYGGVRFSYKF